ncbi:zf-HC2 domain-containing protein [Aquabacterium sp.]|uniref:zf-HC2 domain-containing protein n=1 Tax=Aquabacterium sp. TaxID=1872578 RepID=UPI002CCDEC1D|nr:zf-HC2 domain-containing protein [Aquabacterium sp.]HSW04325.1 zf-HC2 domain-containing protein [Aquabacterium sp.]
MITPTGSMATEDSQRAHAQVWELLPWLVNGRADDGQRALAEAHLLHCAGCRAELSAQQQLQRVVLQEPLPEPDAQAGLARLMGRLAEPVEQQPAPVLAPRRSSRLQLTLAAAVVVQAVGLGLMSLHLLQGDDSGFRTLSQSAPVSAAATLRVVPGAEMAMADWQALLQAQGLRVVDGPNAVGAYALAPDQATGARGAELLARLRATPGIRLAEAIGSAP